MSLFRKHLCDPAVRNALLIGGTNPQAQLRALGEGVDIVVGTPGGRCACCSWAAGGGSSSPGATRLSWPTPPDAGALHPPTRPPARPPS